MKNTENKHLQNSKRYYAMALDPIHIGVGGYRLGRVDNTIIREPTTNIPKIPGTSLKGVARRYTAYKYGIGNENCILGKDDPCGKCDICIAFGYTNHKSENLPKSFHGLIQFSDLRIVLFPIYSIRGPVWITSPRRLKNLGIKDGINLDNEKIKTNVIGTNERLNLGWLYLENEGDLPISGEILAFIPKDIRENIVLVPNKLYSQLINSNLEVRTSTAINPATGAVEEKALYTFEAIPRTTIFWADMVVQDPDHFKTPKRWKKNKEELFQLFERAFPYLETLGIGGMSTRGFGRLRFLFNKGDENIN